MGTVTVRDASAEDASRLLEIYRYYVENTAVSFEVETPSVEAFRGRIRETLKKYPYLALEEDGTVQGYAYAGPFKNRAAYDWCCETTIYLDRAARGRGLGRQLYTALEGRLREMGILDLYACIGFPEKEDEYLTQASTRFHARMGYSTVGKFPDCGYKFGRWYGMIWMRKTTGRHLPEQPPVRFRGG